jgi:hypothetical protein
MGRDIVGLPFFDKMIERQLEFIAGNVEGG